MQSPWTNSDSLTWVKIDLTIATNFFAGYNKYLPKGWANFATLLIHRQTRHTHKMGQPHAQKEMHIGGGRARQTNRQTDRERDRLILFVIITNANNERFCMATGTGSRQLAIGGTRQTWTRCGNVGRQAGGNQGNGLPDSCPKQTYKQAPPQAEPLADSLPVYSLSRTCKSTAATPKKRCLCNGIYTSKYVKPSRFSRVE